MTPVDIFNNILIDRPKINYWMNKNESKVSKLFRNQFQFPKFFIESYKHTTSEIEYILLYLQQNAQSKITNKLIATSNLGKNKFFIDFGFGYDIDKTNKKCIASAVLDIYNAHFFTRFRERYLKKDNIPINEILGAYFAKLTRLNLLEINDEIILDWKERYGKFSSVFYTNLGVCLGNSSICQPPNLAFEKGKANEVVVHEYKTFISFDMLTEKQKEAIKEEGLKYYDRYIEHLNDLHEVGAIK